MAADIEQFRVADPDAEQRAQAAELAEILEKRGADTGGISIFAVPLAGGVQTYVTRRPESLTVDAVPGSPDLYTVSVGTTARPLGEGTRGGVSAMAIPPAGWDMHDSDDLSVKQPQFRRHVHWELHHQVSDHEPGREYWQYFVEANGHSRGAWEMYRLWVEAMPLEDCRADGVPAPKQTYSSTEGCETVTEGLSISSGSPVQAGASLTVSRTTCEEYGPKLYDDPGHYASIWECRRGRPLDQGVVRHVAMIIPVSTARGTVPRWKILDGQETRRI